MRSGRAGAGSAGTRWASPSSRTGWGTSCTTPWPRKNADRAFEPGTAVNYEVQVFLPGHAGCFVAIETFLFGDEKVTLATEQVPYGLAVIE